MDGLSAELTSLIERMGRNWMPVSDVVPMAWETVVLAWDGQLHRARYAPKFTVPEFIHDDDYGQFTECDTQGTWWMREGWYEWIGENPKAAACGYDEFWAMIENPVTHWMMQPAPPEAVQVVPE